MPTSIRHIPTRMLRHMKLALLFLGLLGLFLIQYFSNVAKPHFTDILGYSDGEDSSRSDSGKINLRQRTALSYALTSDGGNTAKFSALISANNISRMSWSEQKSFIWDLTAKDVTDQEQTRPWGKRKRFPECILIGERKTGTTALLRFLEMHPQIKASHKEVHYFDNNALYLRGPHYYLDQMRKSRPHDVSFEKSPSYFRTSVVPARMARFLPDVKLLLGVRDPVKRAISDFHFCREMNFPSFNNTKYETFEEYVINSETGEVNTDFPPIERSYYDKSLSEWLKYYTLENFYIMDGDSFSVSNPVKELKKVERFLGLDPFFKEEMFYFNKEKGYYCVSKTGCLFTGSSHPPVDTEVINKLKAVFEPHNKRFYQMTGRDYNW